MKKIAFVWYFNQASQVFPNWRDGHRAALEVINKSHQVDYFLDKKMPKPGDYDYLLFWSSSEEDFFNDLDQYKTEGKALCLTTNPRNFENLQKMGVIFVESSVVHNECRALGLPVIKAFGTDTDFYKPDEHVKKDIHTFYPATFSPWKRQSAIAHLGRRLYCVGTVQPDGLKELEACKNAGVNVEVGYFPAEKIRDYYRRAEHVVIPAIHGSERTALEAMANDIIPDINIMNKKTHSYFDEFRHTNEVSPRDFVVKYYSHKVFADKLLKGLLAL